MVKLAAGQWYQAQFRRLERGLGWPGLWQWWRRGCGALLAEERVKADALSVDEAAARTAPTTGAVAADLQVRPAEAASGDPAASALVERLEVLPVSLSTLARRAR